MKVLWAALLVASLAGMGAGLAQGSPPLPLPSSHVLPPYPPCVPGSPSFCWSVFPLRGGPSHPTGSEQLFYPLWASVSPSLKWEL